MNKETLFITVTFCCFMFSIPLLAQNSEFEPNTLKQEYYSDSKVIDKKEFDDKKGNSFKIENTERSKGLYIKKDKTWLKQGVWFEFYEGRLSTKIIYDKGKKNGISERYFNNGKFQFIDEYKNGLLDGKSFQYNDKGTLLMECPYLNDKKDGLRLQYRENGSMIFKTNFKEGKQHGDHFQYDDKGKIVAKEVYELGKKIGETIRY